MSRRLAAGMGLSVVGTRSTEPKNGRHGPVPSGTSDERRFLGGSKLLSRGRIFGCFTVRLGRLLGLASYPRRAVVASWLASAGLRVFWLYY